MTFSSMGKKRRLERLLSKGKIVVVPVDDSLILGPKDGLLDLENTIKVITAGEPSAIMGFKGVAEYLVHNDMRVPFIYNITASMVGRGHTRKVVIASVENALAAGADCVAAHINFGSCYESEMLRNFSQIANECDRLGIPLLAIAYPRSEGINKDYNYEDLLQNRPEEYTELVAHCVRVVSELGADLIKTQYTGSAESFRTVIFAACGKPVIIAGGAKAPVAATFERIDGAMEAGGAGISFGRNVFNADHIVPYLQGAKDIVFNRRPWREVFSDYNKMIGGSNG